MDRFFNIMTSPFKSYFEKQVGEFLDADLVTNFFSLNAPELNNILIKNQKAETFSKKFMDDVPFDLHSATIKHLKLSVPLSKIYSESVVITCKKVYVVLKLKKNYTYETFRLCHEKKLEKLKNPNLSEAEKKKGFFDDLMKNIFEKMQIHLEDLVVQLFLEDPNPAIEEQFNMMLKVSKIKKTYNDQVGPATTLLESMHLSSSNLGMDQSGNMFGPKQIEQRFTLEVKDTTFHLLNRARIDTPEYVNIKGGTSFPWEWPSKLHPSTIAYIETISGTMQVEKQIANVLERIQSTKKLAIPSTVQIQIEPYQLKLLLRSIKPFQSYFNLREYYQSRFFNEKQGGRLSETVLSQHCSGGIDLEQIVQQSQNLDDQQLFQSVVNVSHQKNIEETFSNAHSKEIASKQEVNFFGKISSRTLERNTIALNMHKIKIILYKTSPRENQSMGYIEEYARSWKDTAGPMQYADKRTSKTILPCSSIVANLSKLQISFVQKDDIFNKLTCSLTQLKMKSKNLISNEIVQSQIFSSANVKRTVSPAFNELYSKSLKLVDYMPLQNSFYVNETILYVGSDFKPKYPGVLENLQGFREGIRKNEIQQFYLGYSFGEGFKQTRQVDTFRQAMESKSNKVQELLSNHYIQKDATLEINNKKEVTIKCPTLHVQFSFELLADLNNILFPSTKLGCFKDLLTPFDVVPSPNTQQQPQKVNYSLTCNLGFVRAVWNTWKLSNSMADYRQFSKEEQLSMHNATATHYIEFPDPSVNEPFGLIFEFDRLCLKSTQQIELSFFVFDIFTYEISTLQERKIAVNRLLSIAIQISGENQKPSIVISEKKQMAQQKINQLQEIANKRFNRKSILSNKTYTPVAPLEQNDLHLKDRFDNFQQTFDKFYTQIEGAHISNQLNSHVTLQITANIPLLQVDIEHQQLKLLDRFLQIMLIQLERLDQGRTILSDECMKIEQEKPTVNPIVLWINELKNNMFIELNCREANAFINCGLHLQDGRQSFSIIDSYKCIYTDLRELRAKSYLLSINLLGLYTGIRINMTPGDIITTQRKDATLGTNVVNQEKQDRMVINLTLIVQNMVLVDENQGVQNRMSVFNRRAKALQAQQLAQHAVINADTFCLSSYYQYKCLLFSEGIQNLVVKEKDPPCLSLSFEMNKKEETNLTTLEKQITQFMDIRYLKVQNINVRLGDGKFAFLHLPQKVQEPSHYDRIDERLEGRKMQMAALSVVHMYFGIKTLKLTQIAIHIPQIYSFPDFVAGEQLRSKLIQAAIEQKAVPAINLTDVQQHDRKDDEMRMKNEVFVGHVQSVVAVREISLRMILQKKVMQSKIEMTVSSMQLGLKDLLVASLVDRSIYRDFGENLSQKDQLFPYMIYQNPVLSSYKVNFIKDFTDSYLQSLGFDETVTLNKVYFELQTYQSDHLAKQSKLLFLSTGILNVTVGISYMESLSLYIDSLKEMLSAVDVSNTNGDLKQAPLEEGILNSAVDQKINDLYQTMVKDSSMYEEADDCVIMTGETQKWKKPNYRQAYETLYESSPSQINFLQVIVEVGSIGVQLTQKCIFKFEEQRLGNNGSDSPILIGQDEIDGVQSMTFAPNVIKDYLTQDRQKEHRITTKIIRYRISTPQFKSLKLGLQDLRFQINTLRAPFALATIDVLHSFTLDLNTLDIRLQLQDKHQLIETPLLEKTANQDERSPAYQQEFLSFMMNYAEKDSIYCPKISLQLNQSISVNIQNSFFDLYKEISSQTDLMKTDYDPDWYQANKEGIARLTHLTKQLIESIPIEHKRSNKKSKQNIDKPLIKWKANQILIRQFKLVLSCKAEQLSIGSLSAYQLLNLKNFDNIEICFIQVCLTDQTDIRETINLIKQLYIEDIKQQRHVVILDVLKKVPVISEFVSASQGLYQLIWYPILYPLSGKGFLDGITQGVKGFVGSVAEIGSNIGSIFVSGTQTIVSLTKGH